MVGINVLLYIFSITKINIWLRFRSHYQFFQPFKYLEVVQWSSNQGKKNWITIYNMKCIIFLINYGRMGQYYSQNDAYLMQGGREICVCFYTELFTFRSLSSTWFSKSHFRSSHKYNSFEYIPQISFNSSEKFTIRNNFNYYYCAKAYD